MLNKPLTNEQLADAMIQALTKKETLEEPVAILATLEQEQISKTDKLWVNTKTGIAQELAMKEAEKQKIKTLEEMVPPKLIAYKDVFDKKKAE